MVDGMVDQKRCLNHFVLENMFLLSRHARTNNPAMMKSSLTVGNRMSSFHFVFSDLNSGIYGRNNFRIEACHFVFKKSLFLLFVDSINYCFSRKQIESINYRMKGSCDDAGEETFFFWKSWEGLGFLPEKSPQTTRSKGLLIQSASMNT